MIDSSLDKTSSPTPASGQPGNPAKNPSLSDVATLFDRTWAIYTKRFWELTAIIILPIAVWILFVPILGILAGASIILLIGGHISFVIIGIIVAFAICVVFEVWCQMALVYTVKDWREDIGIVESFKRARTKIVSGFWVSTLSGLAMALGFLLFVVPGVIFAVWFAFSIFVLIAEDIKGTKALSRSKDYVSYYWFPVFGRLFVFFILTMILYGLTAIFGVASGLAEVVLGIIITPISIIYSYLIYENLRLIKTKV